MSVLIVFAMLFIYLLISNAHRNPLTLFLPLIIGGFAGICMIGLAAGALGGSLVPILAGLGAAGGVASGILDVMRGNRNESGRDRRPPRA